MLFCIYYNEYNMIIKNNVIINIITNDVTSIIKKKIKVSTCHFGTCSKDLRVEALTEAAALSA